jgi:hypothetical protein
MIIIFHLSRFYRMIIILHLSRFYRMIIIFHLRRFHRMMMINFHLRRFHRMIVLQLSSVDFLILIYNLNLYLVMVVVLQVVLYDNTIVDDQNQLLFSIIIK